jgi:hypothetical protein
MAEYGARYYAENIDKIKSYQLEYTEKNKERRNQYSKLWKQQNPEKVNAQTAARRAARFQRTPRWLTVDDLQRIEDFYLEAIRRTQETGIRWHVDHIIPLRGKKVSGLHMPENLQVIPAKDNQRKNNKYEA